MKRLLALFVLTPMSVAGQADTALYPTDVLAHSFAMTPAQVDSEQTKFLTWLAHNEGHIDPRYGGALREHLYLLIDNRARLNLASHGTVVPRAPDTTLAALFDWGARMGLVGAGVVAESLSVGTTEHLHAGNVPDTPLVLTYTPPYYTIAAPNIGWSVRFPYYFMITTAGHRQANTGVVTDNVMLSTLWGADSSGFRGREAAERSQATILLLSASRADSAAFVPYWLNAVGFSFSDVASETLLPGATTYRAGPNAQHVLRECVITSADKGVLMIMYMGLPGTYEDNRPHFLALLKTLKR